jgi:Uma2 family endonuclease
MSALSHRSILVTPQDFLDGEKFSAVKHEYLNGIVYAMAGGTRRHNSIAINIVTALKPRLRGKPCRLQTSDVLIHLQQGEDERFYYPDVMVVCGQYSPESRKVTDPTIIFEVVSPTTERQDAGEKKDAYLRCESVQTYVLVQPERVEVTVFARRGAVWDATVYNEMADVIPLPAIEAELPLGEVYEE